LTHGRRSPIMRLILKNRGHGGQPILPCPVADIGGYLREEPNDELAALKDRRLGSSYTDE